MNTSNSTNAENTNRSSEPNAARPQLVRRNLIRLLGASVIFGAIVRFVPRGESETSTERDSWLDFPESKTPSRPREARIADARKQLAELSKSYEETHSREIAAARRTLGETMENARRSAPDAAKASAEPFQGLSNTAKCAFRGAADRLDEGDRLKAYSEMALVPVARLAVETVGEVDALLAAVHQVSLQRTNRFHDDTLALTREFELEPAEIGFGENVVRKWQGSLDELFAKRLTAAIGLALEVAMIGFTYRSVVKLLSPVIVKLAQTGSAAAISAVIDGPLPIGDVVAVVLAVGGTIWTVNDIREAVKANEGLPSEIEGTLLAEFVSMEDTAEDYLRHLDQACGSAFRSVL